MMRSGACRWASLLCFSPLLLVNCLSAAAAPGDATVESATAQPLVRPASDGASGAALTAALDAKLRELMRASGAVDHLQQQIDAAVTRAEGNAERMARESAARLQPDAAFRERVQQALDTYVSRVRAQLSEAARGDSWIAVYRKAFSEEEIDQLLAFYRSPLHVRELAVAEDATVHLDGEVSVPFAALTAQPTREYLATLRSLIRDCHCQRTVTPANSTPSSSSPPAP